MCRLSLRSVRPGTGAELCERRRRPLPAELWPTEAFTDLTGSRSAEGVPADYSTFQVTGFPPARGPSGCPRPRGRTGLESQPMITLCIRSGTTTGPLAACPLSAARTEAVGLPAARAGETSAPSVMSEGGPAGGVLAVAAPGGPPAG